MKHNYLKYFRIILAVIGWFFLVISIFTSGQKIANYFSFFTIESNILAVIWFSLAAINKDKDSYISKSVLRGAIAVFLTVTMLVFFVLLGKQFSNVNFVNSYGLHLIIPLAYLFDWLISKPKEKISKSVIYIWLVYPILYTAYTLFRGKIILWYPYFFLSPVEAGSYLNVFYYILGLLGFFVAINSIIYFIHNKLIDKK